MKAITQAKATAQTARGWEKNEPDSDRRRRGTGGRGWTRSSFRVSDAIIYIGNLCDYQIDVRHRCPLTARRSGRRIDSGPTLGRVLGCPQPTPTRRGVLTGAAALAAAGYAAGRAAAHGAPRRPRARAHGPR